MAHQGESSDVDSRGPSVRNIFIVGTTGREKIISEQLEGSKKGGDVVCKTRFFEIPFLKGRYDQGALKYLDDLKSDEFFKDVHLVLFVMDSGRVTEIKQRIIDAICKLDPCVSKISALLLTGCEGKDQAERGKIVQDFYGTSSTKDVVDFMNHGIHAVGFPSTSKTRPYFEEILTEEMKEDAERIVHEMVMNDNGPVDLREIFSKSEGRSTVQHTMGERTPSLDPLLAAKLQTFEKQRKQIADLQELATQIEKTQAEHQRKQDKQIAELQELVRQIAQTPDELRKIDETVRKRYFLCSVL